MSTFILKSTIVAASMMSIVSGQLSMPTPTYSGLASAITDVGCFSNSEPLTDQGFHQYQTGGICQQMCLQLRMPVMAMVDGSNCWCGQLKPPKNSEVDMNECNTPCNGFGQADCGGPSRWLVSLTGVTKNQIDHYEEEVSSSAVASTAAPLPTVTLGGSTVVLTVPGSEPTHTGTGSKTEKSSGPNTAGIAAGVVVGVVAIAALVGGVWFFLKQRRRKAVEEEYKRNAAVSDFIGGKPPGTSHSSLNDARLDPEAMMHRRQSDGSIADNQDYSRRILRVANPDGYR